MTASADTEKPLVFRSTAALVGGWAWMIFAAANFVDIGIQGRDISSVVATTVLLTGCGIAYVLGIRPRVVADSRSVRIHNPLRDCEIPWSAVTKVDAADAVRVHYDGGFVRAWSLPNSPRARARAERAARRDADRLPEAVAKQVVTKTPVDFAVEQLTELRDEHHKDDTEPAKVRRMVVIPAVLSLLVPVLATIVAIAIASS
jgi:hypothetical protein